MEFQNIDFKSDNVKQYKALRSSLAEKHKEEGTVNFGPPQVYIFFKPNVTTAADVLIHFDYTCFLFVRFTLQPQCAVIVFTSDLSATRRLRSSSS